MGSSKTTKDPGAGSSPGRGSERRRHLRVGAEGPGVLVDPSGRQATFQIMDLSESGARLRCSHALPAMTRVGVVLVLGRARPGGGDARRLDTHGVVVWSHESEPGSFDTGVFFPELDDASRSALKAYVTASV